MGFGYIDWEEAAGTKDFRMRMLSVHPALPEAMAMLRQRFPVGIDEAWINRFHGGGFGATLLSLMRYGCITSIVLAPAMWLARAHL
jgi:hypothetical protein